MKSVMPKEAFGVLLEFNVSRGDLRLNFDKNNHSATSTSPNPVTPKRPGQGRACASTGRHV